MTKNEIIHDMRVRTLRARVRAARAHRQNEANLIARAGEDYVGRLSWTARERLRRYPRGPHGHQIGADFARGA